MVPLHYDTRTHEIAQNTVVEHWHYCIGWIWKILVPSQRDTRIHEMAQNHVVLAILSL
jgi:hypothetical protein